MCHTIRAVCTRAGVWPVSAVPSVSMQISPAPDVSLDLDCVARVFLHTLHLTVTVCWDYANDQCSGRMVQSAAVTVASIFSECHHYITVTEIPVY